LIKEICEENDISLESFSSDFVFRLTKSGRQAFIFGYQFGLNSAPAHMICEDKAATSEMLSAAKIPNVEHRCFMSPVNLKYVGSDGNWEEMLDMLKMYGELVLKDNKGTGGLAVMRVKNRAELENAAQHLFLSAHSVSASPFLDILEEYRVIVLDGEIKLIYHKERQQLVGDGLHTIRQLYLAALLEKDDMPIITLPLAQENRVPACGEIYPLCWKHNLGQGAFPVLDTDEKTLAPLRELAQKAADCLGICFASVDIIRERGGSDYKVLEVNSGVMMENFAGVSQKHFQIAKEIYQQAILKMLKTV